MEADNEEDNSMSLAMKLEEANEMVDEAQAHVVAINLDEALRDKLVKLPSPKVSALRAGFKSTHMD